MQFQLRSSSRSSRRNECSKPASSTTTTTTIMNIQVPCKLLCLPVFMVVWASLIVVYTMGFDFHRVLKQDEVHPLLFKGANRKFKNIPWKK